MSVNFDVKNYLFNSDFDPDWINVGTWDDANICCFFLVMVYVQVLYLKISE